MKKLGFGLMRLPLENPEDRIRIDMGTTLQLVARRYPRDAQNKTAQKLILRRSRQLTLF